MLRCERLVRAGRRGRPPARARSRCSPAPSTRQRAGHELADGTSAPSAIASSAQLARRRRSAPDASPHSSRSSRGRRRPSRRRGPPATGIRLSIVMRTGGAVPAEALAEAPPARWRRGCGPCTPGADDLVALAGAGSSRSSSASVSGTGTASRSRAGRPSRRPPTYRQRLSFAGRDVLERQRRLSSRSRCGQVGELRRRQALGALVRRVAHLARAPPAPRSRSAAAAASASSSERGQRLAPVRERGAHQRAHRGRRGRAGAAQHAAARSRRAAPGGRPCARPAARAPPRTRAAPARRARRRSWLPGGAASRSAISRCTITHHSPTPRQLVDRLQDRRHRDAVGQVGDDLVGRGSSSPRSRSITSATCRPRRRLRPRAPPRAPAPAARRSRPRAGARTRGAR